MAPDGDAPQADHEASPVRSDDDLDAHLDQGAEPDPGDDIEDEFGPEDFADDAPDDGEHTALPSKVEAWRKRSATGAILTGFALGLQQVFEKEREQPAIIMTTSGDPPRDLPVEAEFEHGRPRQSVVSIRPWLLGDQARPAAATASSAGTEAREPETNDAGDAGGGDAGHTQNATDAGHTQNARDAGDAGDAGDARNARDAGGDAGGAGAGAGSEDA